MSTTQTPEAPQKTALPIEVEVSHLITEDDEPVDNWFSQVQMRLLTEPLVSSWQTDRKFLVGANVGLFASNRQPPLVPDAMLSLDVELPANLWEKSGRSYFVWEFGKVPDVVIEIVSNDEGGEGDRKMTEYARIGVPFYVIFDPEKKVMPRTLTFCELRGRSYVRLPDAVLPDPGLSLVEWRGAYEGREDHWLRWADLEGNLIPSGAERAEAESARADTEKARAEALAERLRAAGIDPDSV